MRKDNERVPLVSSEVQSLSENKDTYQEIQIYLSILSQSIPSEVEQGQEQMYHQEARSGLEVSWHCPQ